MSRDQWWRELQLAASASAGECVANFGPFFNGAVSNPSCVYQRSSAANPVLYEHNRS